MIIKHCAYPPPPRSCAESILLCIANAQGQKKQLYSRTLKSMAFAPLFLSKQNSEGLYLHEPGGEGGVRVGAGGKTLV